MEASIDYNAAKFWLDLFNVLGLAGLGAYTWVTNRQRVTKDAIDEVTGRVIRLERETAVMKEATKNLPTHQDMDDVDKRLDEVNQGVASLSAEMKANKELLHTIHNHLLNGANKP